MSSTSPDIAKVVTGGYCVGCGACAVAAPQVVSIQRNAFGYTQAVVTQTSESGMLAASSVCPFSSMAKDEDSLANTRFSDCTSYDARVGRYDSLGAGRVLDENQVVRSSSGGLTTWLLVKLMEMGQIDGVIHFGQAASSSELFAFCVSRSVPEIRNRTKSQYYSGDFSDAVSSIRGDGRRYAFVGVPCYVKAARLLAANDPVLAEQLVFFLGLVCGHMKSAAFAELLAWQVGVPPSDLTAVDFRVKNQSADAAGYKFHAKGIRPNEQGTEVTRSLVGGNWGHALFQLKACDFCDDIFAETADACLGDAWIPRYVSDWRGTNVVVSRNKLLTEQLLAGCQNGEIFFECLSADDICQSQDGNFRHRWDGLSVRLEKAVRQGSWIPKKRIKPGSRKVTFLRRALVYTRQRMASESHEAFLLAKRKQSIDVFYDFFSPYARRMRLLYRLMNFESGDKIKKAFLKRLPKFLRQA